MARPAKFLDLALERVHLLEDSVGPASEAVDDFALRFHGFHPAEVIHDDGALGVIRVARSALLSAIARPAFALGPTARQSSLPRCAPSEDWRRRELNPRP